MKISLASLVATAAAWVVTTSTTTVFLSMGVTEAQNSLCNEPPQVTVVPGDCTAASVDLGPLQPCCGLQSIAGNAGASETCRYTEIDKPLCNSLICAEATVNFTIQAEVRTGTCCETCSCWGDPHCEAFNGTTDQWVLCDARVRSGNTCVQSRTQCSQELDHNGNACRWRNRNGAALQGWNVALQGSPCVPDTSGDAPVMDMYSFQGFSTSLVLGERGIIEQMIVRDGDNQYILTSKNCFNSPNSPWRAEEDAKSGPDDPNWLPYSWTPMQKDGTYLWTVSGLNSNVVINVRCVRNRVPGNGKNKFGPPRLNVESLIEPENTNRQNAGGFCVTGSIDKGLATADRSAEMDQACLAHGSELEAARAICSKAVNLRTLQFCKLSFCAINYPTRNSNDCVQMINSQGWNKVFCAANTLASKNVADCSQSNSCQQCVSDISDFGWEYAVSTWLNHNSAGGGVGGKCKTLKDLPTSLIQCQQGITIQYESSPGVWVDFVAIPFGTNLCDNMISVSGDDGAEAQNLLTSRIRIAQCADAGCLSDQCTAEIGWATRLDFASPTAIGEDYYRLIQEGKLICNPARGYENNPTGCVDNFISLCQQCQIECPNA